MLEATGTAIVLHGHGELSMIRSFGLARRGSTLVLAMAAFTTVRSLDIVDSTTIGMDLAPPRTSIAPASSMAGFTTTITEAGRFTLYVRVVQPAALLPRAQPKGAERRKYGQAMKRQLDSEPHVT